MLLLFIVFPFSTKADISIQQVIDEAKLGDTIVISEGIYEEHIVIDKPIHLVGDKEVTLQNKTSEPIVSIQANNVTIENVTFHYETDERSPAIFVQGKENVLTNLQIYTNSIGIQLDGADENELTKITIEGEKNTPINQRQHGIDLWKSNRNHIHHNNITNVQDGIYVESSKENQIHHNYVTNSRYGYHLMFTEETALEKNESYENISGMMVMGTNGTKVQNNLIKYNQKNVQSLGLLLFDVKNATITENEIAHNRIGILIEDALDNDLSFNKIQNNYIGVQFKRAENNTIVNNAFVANVVQGQAENSSNNDTNRNYWGDHVGLDMTGDKVSDLTYEIDPFYLHLTDEYPPYRLLFDSPGMIFLETLLHTPVEERLIDVSPLLENPFSAHSSEENGNNVLLVSSLFFTFSIAIIFMGVKKR